MLKKLKNKTQECIKHIKTMFYTKLAVSLRKKDDICLGYVDWYEQHSWFERKWFKHKLKRLIMRNVYKFIDKLDDVLFEKYHETYYINFNIHVDEYRLKIFELPLIVKIKNGENIKYVAGLINDEIRTIFGFSLSYNDNEIKILDNEQLNLIKSDIERKFSSYIGIGKIKFKTIRFQQFHRKLTEFLPITIKDEDVPFGYKILNTQDIKFGIIETKNKKYLIDKSIEYQIFIKFDEIVKNAINEEPKEIRIDRIKELMGLKPINNNTEK